MVLNIGHGLSVPASLRYRKRIMASGDRQIAKEDFFDAPFDGAGGRHYSGIRPKTTCKRKMAIPTVMPLSATLKAGQCQVPI
jgi:hypothetical protein